MIDEKQLIHEEVGEPEGFYAKIILTGSSRGVIIPHQIITANGWDTNTTLKVWVKKVAQKNNN